jgi:hypothetical protein
MHMHPETYIELVDQDRERAMTKRALQRAAREGGVKQPGESRGGIVGFATSLRSAAATAFHGLSARSGGSSSPALPSGA